MNVVRIDRAIDYTVQATAQPERQCPKEAEASGVCQGIKNSKFVFFFKKNTDAVMSSKNCRLQILKASVKLGKGECQLHLRATIHDGTLTK